jgi:predicted ATPase
LGEYAAYYIEHYSNDCVAENLRHPKGKDKKTLLEQTNLWLQEISPAVSLKTKLDLENKQVDLKYNFTSNHDYKPKNVGYGISYILPVILALLTAQKDKIIIIENPEAHIHPRGQAEMGRLIALAAQAGAQLFIETHSDHILNGIRVAVKKGNIDCNKVNILFFGKEITEAEQYTTITPIRVDACGSLDTYPKDFMDEWSNQLSELI